MKYRFRLKSLILLITLICLALCAMSWYARRAAETWIADSISNLASSKSEPKIILGVIDQNEYCLSNLEVNWSAATGPTTAPPDSPRSDAVFVAMPDKIGRWAHSPKEVMQYLKENR